jgi:hypothetical protein
VSQYQYYEFRALGRRLTADQRLRLRLRQRSLSGRAEISATRVTNEYSFGDFRGDPGRLMKEYFGGMGLPRVRLIHATRKAVYRIRP